jgi:hypothetical protein
MNSIKPIRVAGADAPHGIIRGGRAPCYESAVPFAAHPTRGGSQQRVGKTVCVKLVFSHEQDSSIAVRLCLSAGWEDPDR